MRQLQSTRVSRLAAERTTERSLQSGVVAEREQRIEFLQRKAVSYQQESEQLQVHHA